MSCYIDSVKDLELSKNDDGTYHGTKITDFLDQSTNKTYKAKIIFPRLNITWKNNIELGEAESIDILSTDKDNDRTDELFWTAEILE